MTAGQALQAAWSEAVGCQISPWDWVDKATCGVAACRRGMGKSLVPCWSVPWAAQPVSLRAPWTDGFKLAAYQVCACCWWGLVSKGQHDPGGSSREHS